MILQIINDIINRNRICNWNEIDYNTANNMLNENSKCVLLDVRSPQEFKENNLKGSINIPFYDISKKIKNVIPIQETPIIVYCQTGSRSKKVINTLIKLGYNNLYNITGGMDNI